MNKILSLLFILSIGFVLSSCDSTTDPVIPPVTTGSIYLESTPAGAEIWVDGINSGKVTPDSVVNLDEGNRNITLKLADYDDTTFTMTVIAGQQVSKDVTMISNLFLTFHGTARLWETLGTTADQPSGLDLSSGNPYGISSADKDKVDIYYSSNGYLVKSADLASGLTRVTAFMVGGASDLNDGIDSPLRSTGIWLDNMDDREPNYVYLYDNDGHYSKIKIVNSGGGFSGEDAWVEVEWWYNETVDDVRF
ncbi:MAG TPA: PEGA domain-containing protein [Ignavibacteriaceae bacterium]|nr:PEGA domain-containing protein [Ignavibacteriaceae bacterium]